MTRHFLHRRQDFIKRQIFEQRFPLLRIISVPCRELVQKPHRVYDAHLLREQVNRVSCNFTQGLCLDIHCVTSVISSSGETTLVCPVSTALARFRNRSSQVQKYSAFAITADARWSASTGLIPSS